jgi:hypothetical protein
MNNIAPFTQGNAMTIRRLNQIVEAVNRVNNFTGDQCIKITRGRDGYTISLVMDQVNARIIKNRGGGSGGVYRAITTEAAPAATNITCNLYDSTGTEITSGEGSGIEVYCSIIGGGNLNAAVPRLEDNDDLFVVNLPYKNGTATESRYFCTSLFQASQDC